MLGIAAARRSVVTLDRGVNAQCSFYPDFRRRKKIFLKRTRIFADSLPLAAFAVHSADFPPSTETSILIIKRKIIGAKNRLLMRRGLSAHLRHSPSPLSLSFRFAVLLCRSAGEGVNS